MLGIAVLVCDSNTVMEDIDFIGDFILYYAKLPVHEARKQSNI